MAYRFLCGADMEPSAVRAANPGGRFVARACLPPADGTPPEGVWGILIEVPGEVGAGDAGPALRVTADDGRAFTASRAATPGGDPAALLAAARYWELPPAYVRSLPGWAEPAEGT